MFENIRKEKKLRSISKILGADIQSYHYDPARIERNNKALEELCDLCATHPPLRRVLDKYGIDRANLEAYYQDLIAGGAGQWAGGHYVAVSALGYASTLEFLLQHGGKLSQTKRCVLLIEYFERGNVGSVPTSMD